jgi:hypothetical protein
MTTENPISLSESRAAAMTRAAEAMIQLLGAAPVAIRFPMSATITGPALATITEDLALAPVHIRQLANDSNGRRRFELLVSATPLNAMAESQGADDVDAMLAAAVGVVYGDALLRVNGVASDQTAGVPYLYRIEVVE